MRITARRWPAQRRACSRINQSSRHLMLVAKPRNRKWRLILRTCCPPPAAALRAAYARCARVFSLFFCLFHSVILPKKCLFFELRRQRATFACRRNSASGRRQRLTRGLGRSPSLGSGAGSPSGVRGRAPRRKFCFFRTKNRPKIGCELLPKSPQTRAQCTNLVQ